MHPACHPNLVQSQLHAHVLQRMNGLPRLPPSLSRLPPQCAKVRVSQPRLYGCLLHRGMDYAHPPHNNVSLESHPPARPDGLERRLQPAPAAGGRGTAPPHVPPQPKPLGTPPPGTARWLGTPASAGTRGRRPRHSTTSRSPTAKTPRNPTPRHGPMAWNAGFSRHPWRESAAEWTTPIPRTTTPAPPPPPPGRAGRREERFLARNGWTPTGRCAPIAGPAR